ncbi:hypothetical protein AHAS_Ahas09G0093500 [Arachis hypogaea]
MREDSRCCSQPRGQIVTDEVDYEAHLVPQHGLWRVGAGCHRGALDAVAPPTKGPRDMWPVIVGLGCTGLVVPPYVLGHRALSAQYGWVRQLAAVVGLSPYSTATA